MPEIGGGAGPPEAHKTTHQDGGSDEIDISGLTGATEIVDTPADGVTTKGISSNWAYDHKADANAHHVPSVVYVDRGDPAAFDFDKDDFTVVQTWTDLDLSSIVPAGTIAVALFIAAYWSGANPWILFRKKGNVNEINMSGLQTQLAYISMFSDLIVSVDENRKIQYWSYGPPTSCSVAVKGWWIK